MPNRAHDYDDWMDARLDYAAQKKSLLAAYCLLFFFGLFGAHRFYLKRNVSAWIMLGLTLTVVGLAITIFWVMLDLILIPFVTGNTNREIRRYVGA